jgi:hypothetical protein
MRRRKAFERTCSYQPKDDYDGTTLFDASVDAVVGRVVDVVFLGDGVTPDLRWARLGLLQRVLEMGLRADKGALIQAIRDVNALLEDVTWQNSAWLDEGKVRLVLETLRNELTALRKRGFNSTRLDRETLLPPRVLAALANGSKSKPETRPSEKRSPGRPKSKKPAEPAKPKPGKR